MREISRLLARFVNLVPCDPRRIVLRLGLERGIDIKSGLSGLSTSICRSICTIQINETSDLFRFVYQFFRDYRDMPPAERFVALERCKRE